VLPHTFGLTFAVASIDTLVGALRANDVTYRYTRDGVCVPRQHAHNTVLEFVPAITA